MSTHNIKIRLSTLLKRLALCGLAALALSASSLCPSAALPPSGGGDPDPNPNPPSTPTYKAELYISSLFKYDAHNVMVYVRNQGNTASSPCYLRLTVYTYDVLTGGITPYTTAYYSVPAIQPGGFSTIWTYSSPSIYFSHFYFNWTVDAFNAVVEWNENNNDTAIFNP